MEKGVSANRVIVSVLTVLVLVPLCFPDGKQRPYDGRYSGTIHGSDCFRPGYAVGSSGRCGRVAVLLAVFRGTALPGCRKSACLPWA